MPSPVTIPVTPIMVTPKQPKRQAIRFQNTGTNPIYIVKQPNSGALIVPSATVYDYYLPARNSSEEQGQIVEVKSIARFDAIAVGGVGTLAVAKTFKIN